MSNLKALRDEVLGQIERRRTELGEVADIASVEGRDDEHDPDGATAAFEHSLVVGLLRQDEARLAEVDAALDRVAAGTYGVCIGCGRPIAAERLAARPEAATCVACGRSRGSRSEAAARGAPIKRFHEP